jgi:hypothetical protein
MSHFLRIQPLEQRARTARVIEDWIESAKRVLIQIQLRDNLEKNSSHAGLRRLRGPERKS